MKPHHSIRIADATLSERAIIVEHSTPSGRQILEAAGLTPADEYFLCAILPTGDFEDVRLAEAFDLGTQGVERFIAFRSDRVFRLMLNEHQLAWGEPCISGSLIKKLAGVNGDDHEVIQNRANRESLLVRDADIIDLSKLGVEQLTTRIRTTTIIVNGTRKSVTGTTISFEALIALAFANPPSGEGVQFTVQFTRGPEDKPSGAMVNGQSVKLKNGMEFDVTSTNRS